MARLWGAETAVALTQVRARARATGCELSFPIVQAIRVKDGRIAGVRPFHWDTRAIVDPCTGPTPMQTQPQTQTLTQTPTPAPTARG